MRELTAKIVERADLADILRGRSGSSGPNVAISEAGLPVKLGPGQVGVVHGTGHHRPLPNMLIVRRGEPRELFAWVNTYCPFVTPLSQWCRVVEEEELKRMGTIARVPEYGNAMTAWAGAVIGEAMLRLGVQAGPSPVSVMTLQSCSTFVAARAFGLWGESGMGQVTACYEEARQLLGARSGTANFGEYERIWTVLKALDGEVPGRSQVASLSHATKLAIECCRDIQRNGFVERTNLIKTIDALGWSGDFDKYEQSSAERRLEICDLAIAHLTETNRATKRNSDVLAEFIVAYFASKISGNVAGHIQLIEGLISRWPMTILWYGIVSALYQPEIWVAEFNGLARLAARELEFPVRLDEAPRCDVSWVELCTLVEPNVTYSTLGFRGASPRALSVELALGVAGVIRVRDATEETPKRAAVRTNEVARWRMRHVVDILRSATDEAKRVQEALEEEERRERSTGSSAESERSTRRLVSGERKGKAKGSGTVDRYRDDKLPFDESC